MITEDNILKISVHDIKENWDMEFNLDKIFFDRELKEIMGEDYEPDPDIIHYTKWQRIKKIIKLLNKNSWCNEGAVKDLKEWLMYQISIYKNFRDEEKKVNTKLAKERVKEYKKKIDLLEKALKEVENGK